MALLREVRAARDLVLASPAISRRALATQRGRCRHRLAKLVQLSWLAPKVVSVILEGRQPSGLTARRLLDMRVPLAWADQAAALGIGEPVAH